MYTDINTFHKYFLLLKLSNTSLNIESGCKEESQSNQYFLRHIERNFINEYQSQSNKLIYFHFLLFLSFSLISSADTRWLDLKTETAWLAIALQSLLMSFSLIGAPFAA